MENEQPSVGKSVLEFYRVLPFNYRQSVAEHAREIKDRNAIKSYPVLPPLLETPGMRVLEIGSGPGWMSNGIAHHYGCPVTGLDFNPVAVERAQAVAEELGVNSEFQVADLFQWSPETPYPLVVSLGVLHHTDDCQGAVQRLCNEFTAPDGHVLIGLYHEPGRRPFLDHFADMKSAGASEVEMLERFRELDSHIKDETHLMSWFRDQVLHPHETQHTLKEMVAIIEDCGMTLESTSINRFQPIVSAEDLYARERGYADIAAERLAAGQYFPGFFVFLARKAG
jgi:SAM-dependent methyltransferase